MRIAIRGIVRGKVIELANEPGLPDGQEASVTLEPVSLAMPPNSDGALAGYLFGLLESVPGLALEDWMIP